jgi:hypothetical protein
MDRKESQPPRVTKREFRVGDLVAVSLTYLKRIGKADDANYRNDYGIVKETWLENNGQMIARVNWLDYGGDMGTLMPCANLVQFVNGRRADYESFDRAR